MSDLAGGKSSFALETAVMIALNEAFAQGGAFSSVTLSEMLNRHGVMLSSRELAALLERGERAGTLIRVLRQPGYENDPESAWPKWRKVTMDDLERKRILTWEKPPRAEPYEEWAKYQSDDCPPGNYAPNMDEEWRAKWKAKMAGQRSEGLGELRVEISKTVAREPDYAQVLIVAWADGRVRMSMNGKAHFTERDWQHLHMAVLEAREAMSEWRLQEARKRQLAAERARNK